MTLTRRWSLSYAQPIRTRMASTGEDWAADFLNIHLLRQKYTRADLPRKERWAWINAQNNYEAKSELKSIWTMFKTDPIEPFRVYFGRYVVTGLGLFVEGSDTCALPVVLFLTFVRYRLYSIFHWQPERPLQGRMASLLEHVPRVQQDLGRRCGC